MPQNIICTVSKYKTLIREVDVAFVSKQTINDKDINLSGNNNYNSCAAIHFQKCIIYEFPTADSIKKSITSLTVLDIRNCTLSKIKSDDLKGYDCLKELYMRHGEIEYLPSDLFKYTPDLEVVSFYKNNIKFIDDTILDPLRNLKIFSVLQNVNINAKYDSINNGGNNMTLEQLKNEIKTKCKRTSELCLNEVRMNSEMEKLKAKNDQLANKCENQNKDIKKLKTEGNAHKKNINSMKTNISNLKKTCTELTKEKKTMEAKVKESKEEICRFKRVSKMQQKEIRILKLKWEKSKTSKAVQLKQNKLFKAKFKNFETKFELIAQQFRMVKELSKDFTVNIGLKQYKVHKAMLIANSKVIETHIDENPDSDCLELNEVSHEMFQFILNFLSDGTLPTNEANLVELFDACCKLEIAAMMPIVKGLLRENINPVNALDVLFLCDKYKGDGNDELKMKAFDEFKKNFPNQVLTPELATNPDKLKKILQTKQDLDEMMMVY